MDESTSNELEEAADESGYGAAESDVGDAPDQVLPVEAVDDREENSRDDDDDRP